LIIEGRSFSFRELDRLSNRLANAFTGIGVAPSDRVSLYSSNCLEWIVAYCAVLKTGAVINPIGR
jgi:long-chain acyl-CoA synthetase